MNETPHLSEKLIVFTMVLFLFNFKFPLARAFLRVVKKEGCEKFT